MKSATKLFGIGLSRTGTVSLTKALLQLGINAKHYPNDTATQEELKRGYYSLSILEEVQALLDIPVAPYYAQFDQVYSEAKFILTTRPTESWLASMEIHYRLYVEKMRDDFDDYVMACVYGALHFSRERFTYVKELHERNVTEYFSERPEKLLVFDVFRGDSWPELCRFLDCPIPDVPYPHRNMALTSPATRQRQSWVQKLLGKTSWR
jgi:Sulfotransferase domain